MLWVYSHKFNISLPISPGGISIEIKGFCLCSLQHTVCLKYGFNLANQILKWNSRFRMELIVQMCRVRLMNALRSINISEQFEEWQWASFVRRSVHSKTEKKGLSFLSHFSLFKVISQLIMYNHCCNVAKLSTAISHRQQCANVQITCFMIANWGLNHRPAQSVNSPAFCRAPWFNISSSWLADDVVVLRHYPSSVAVIPQCYAEVSAEIFMLESRE